MSAARFDARRLFCLTNIFRHDNLRSVLIASLPGGLKMSLGKDGRDAFLSRPALAGLNDLAGIIDQTITVITAEDGFAWPADYGEYELRRDLSNSQNWYVAGMGHITPSPEECLRYARSYLARARK
jgi:hypothetical protein